MSFLPWKPSKSKPPRDLIKSIGESLHKIDQTCKKQVQLESICSHNTESTDIVSVYSVPNLQPEDKKTIDKINEDISKNLSILKGLLYGEEGREVSPDILAQVSSEFYASDILLVLIQHIYILEFESRKDVSQIFSQLLRRQIGDRYPTVDHFYTKNSVLAYLTLGYAHQETALICGLMLRECIKHATLAQIALEKTFSLVPDTLAEPHLPEQCQQMRIVMKLFDFIETPTFDIASDAFVTLKELLIRHKAMVSKFLIDSYDSFFAKFNSLLQSPNYVTRRQSLKLLGEILLDRSNFEIMSKYIDNVENLKLMMNLLRDKSKNIQYEAFHVFKIFVANPNRPKAIQDILFRNKERLISFLNAFQPDRTDEQFSEERAYLIKQISSLEPIHFAPQMEQSIGSDDMGAVSNES